MENKIWFTSDWHFGHDNIIKYCDRPFESTEDMHNVIIAKYMNKISPDDIVFVLGDLTIKRGAAFKTPLAKLITSLPGKKHLIKGNHDYYSKTFYLNECGFLTINKKITTEKYVIVHDPASYSFDDLRSKKILIHGHKHNNKFDRRKKYKFDIGVDGNDFFPISLEEIKNIYKLLDL